MYKVSTVTIQNGKRDAIDLNEKMKNSYWNITWGSFK